MSTTTDLQTEDIISKVDSVGVVPVIVAPDSSMSDAIPAVATVVDAVAITPAITPTITPDSSMSTAVEAVAITPMKTAKRRYVRCAKGTRREKKRKGKSTRRCVSKKRCATGSRRNYTTGKCTSKQ